MASTTTNTNSKPYPYHYYHAPSHVPILRLRNDRPSLAPAPASTIITTSVVTALVSLVLKFYTVSLLILTLPAITRSLSLNGLRLGIGVESKLNHYQYQNFNSKYKYIYIKYGDNTIYINPLKRTSNRTGSIIMNTDYGLGDNNTVKASNASASKNKNENDMCVGENDSEKAMVIVDINDTEEGTDEIGIGMGELYE